MTGTTLKSLSERLLGANRRWGMGCIVLGLAPLLGVGCTSLPEDGDLTENQAGSASQADSSTNGLGVVGILSADKTPVRMCRANYAGGRHPGRRRDGSSSCYITYGGVEIATTGEGIELIWASAQNGNIPSRAMSFLPKNTPEVFVCRGQYRSSLQVGRIEPGFAGCKIPFDGVEVVLNDYEVLMRDWHLNRVDVRPNAFWKDRWDLAPIFGSDIGGAPLYLCTGLRNGIWYLGKMQKEWNHCNIGLEGREISVSIEEGVQVVLPGFAAKLGVGSDNYWHAGYEANGAPLGICQALYLNEMYLGKQLPDHHCNIAINGKEVSVTEKFGSLLEPEMP